MARLPTNVDDRTQPEREGWIELSKENVFWLRRLAESAPDLVKLADHADDIIAGAEDRKWWRGFKRRGKAVIVWLGMILAAIGSTIAVLRSISPPPGAGGH